MEVTVTRNGPATSTGTSGTWLHARSNCTNKNALNMKYGNFYDLESLTLLNRHEGCACSIKECDVKQGTVHSCQGNILAF